MGSQYRPVRVQESTVSAASATRPMEVEVVDHGWITSEYQSGGRCLRGAAKEAGSLAQGPNPPQRTETVGLQGLSGTNRYHIDSLTTSSVLDLLVVLASDRILQ